MVGAEVTDPAAADLGGVAAGRTGQDSGYGPHTHGLNRVKHSIPHSPIFGSLLRRYLKTGGAKVVVTVEELGLVLGVVVLVEADMARDQVLVLVAGVHDVHF